MDAHSLRKSTKKTVEHLGYQFNPNLPLLDEGKIKHDCSEVANRILALYVCVACAYGFSKASGAEWLRREWLWDALTEPEREFLAGRSEAVTPTIQWQVEALWSLTWAAGYHDDLDFLSPCPDSFVKIFPDLKKGEGTENFKGKCKLRSLKAISEKLDLYYCLHWAVRNSELRDSQIERRQNMVEGQVYIERRRALEWILSDEDWSDLSLDT